MHRVYIKYVVEFKLLHSYDKIVRKSLRKKMQGFKMAFVLCMFYWEWILCNYLVLLIKQLRFPALIYFQHRIHTGSAWSFYW